MSSIFHEAAKLTEENVPFAIATLIKTVGSGPRHDNPHMIVTKDKKTFGTVGGGKVEFKVIEDCYELIKNEGKSVYKTYGGCTQSKMVCGASVEVFIDVVKPKHKIMIIGGGHVGLKLAELAEFVGWDILIIDQRKEFCNKTRFPMARKCFVVEGDLEKSINLIPDSEFTKNTSIAIVTFQDDKKAFNKLFKHLPTVGYFGKMGSKSNASFWVDYLRNECKFNENFLQKFYSPIGIKIGHKLSKPSQVAISIITQITQILNPSQKKFNDIGKTLSLTQNYKNIVIVRGGGDLASGTILRLHKAGFKVISLELEKPTVIRRTVSFAQAMFKGETEVEGVKGVRVVLKKNNKLNNNKNINEIFPKNKKFQQKHQSKFENIDEIFDIIESGKIPIVCDPNGELIDELKPYVLIDAIIAKKNLFGIQKGKADITIGLGPGFTSGKDVDVVIETNRGHFLGKVIYDPNDFSNNDSYSKLNNGQAQPDTKTPGNIGGYSIERLLKSPSEGIFKLIEGIDIGTIVKKGDTVAKIQTNSNSEEKFINVKAKIDGVIRGLLNDGIYVTKGFKIGDIDPRSAKQNCSFISDKARSIGGSVLEAILNLSLKLENKNFYN